MSQMRLIPALLLVVAGCTAGSESAVATTSVPSTTTSVPTTTTIAAAAAINLGEASADVAYCLGHASVLSIRGEELGIANIPRNRAEFEAWVAEHPDDFSSVCALAYWWVHRKDVGERIAGIYGADALEAIEESLSDTERVWCYEHWAQVGDAADILRVGPSDLLPELLGIPPRDSLDSGDADILAMWANLAPDSYVRACRAAFGSR